MERFELERDGESEGKDLSKRLKMRVARKTKVKRRGFWHSIWGNIIQRTRRFTGRAMSWTRGDFLKGEKRKPHVR